MSLTDEKMAEAIVRALADEHSRKILLAILTDAKSAEQISEETSIPVSTCYRRIHDLKREGMLVQDHVSLTTNGRKSITFKSMYRHARVNVSSGQFTVEVRLNSDGPQDIQTYGSCTSDRLSAFVEQKKDLKVLNRNSAIQNGISPVLTDCDLCQDEDTWCSPFRTGDSQALVFACLKCEKDLKPSLKPALA